MNTGQHPAPPPGGSDVPALTLVLPPGLVNDQVLAGLAETIAQVRTQLAARAQLFHHRAGQNAASGGQLGQALCRGEALGSEHAVAAIDEAIVEMFGLWQQYEAQLSATGNPVPSAEPPEPSAGWHAHDPSLAAPPAACTIWPRTRRSRRHDRPCH